MEWAHNPQLVRFEFVAFRFCQQAGGQVQK
jgi:hypothetical protein